MKAFKLLALTSCVLLAAGNGVAQQNYSKSEGLLQYVDPYIGSGYHGHVFVGTSVPYGMVQSFDSAFKLTSELSTCNK